MPDTNKTRMPRFHRAVKPPPMSFQSRDGALLQTICDFDGVMTRRHIKELFWPASSQQAMEARLSKLFHNGYLDWPDAEQRRTRPIPEPLVWLGWKGILEVAISGGIEVEPPKKENENQLRLFQTRLRRCGIRWVREPNWNQPLHDIVVADFRLALLKALKHTPSLAQEEWIPESSFRAEPDLVKFTFQGNNGSQRKKSKGVCPDGFFTLADQKRAKRGMPHRAMFLLEVDMATHDNNSFGIEKAAAGAAYIQDPMYKKRFGSNTGRWLVVTTGEIRLKNLLRQTKRHAAKASDLFYFSTLENVQSHNLLTDPIWHQVGHSQPMQLPFADE